MKQELIKNSTVSKFENIAGQKILVNKGQFWIQTQRQGHSLHYIVPYQACFAPQIPEFFIKNFSSNGDVVLDPFVGSGTACIAALKTNRKYVAYDIDKNYCDLSERRIKQFLQEQITLFSEKNLPPKKI